MKIPEQHPPLFVLASSVVCILAACGGGAAEQSSTLSDAAASDEVMTMASHTAEPATPEQQAPSVITHIAAATPADESQSTNAPATSVPTTNTNSEITHVDAVTPANQSQSTSAPAANVPTNTNSEITHVDAVTPANESRSTSVAANTNSEQIKLLLVSSANTTQTSLPITFGETFSLGEIPAGTSIQARLSNGSSVPLQLDAKAKHPDGSLRHGIFSLVLPRLDAAKTETLVLTKEASTTTTTSNVSLEALLNAGFSAQVNVVVAGKTYSLPVDSLLRSGSYSTWLRGPVASEWIVSGPLKTADGAEHPHLSARVSVRFYAGTNKARVDVTVENDWAYEPSPQNFVYDAQVVVGGQVVYQKSALTHYHHARWRKTFWWGQAPAVQVNHDIRHLIASRAVPNYDAALTISQTALGQLETKWNQARTGPMEPGIVLPYMPTTGGRPDIGPLPQWAAMYLLSMDRRAEKITLGTGDLAGSWPIHYRDRSTGRPVSLKDHPYMTLLGRANDAINPVTKKSDQFPACGGNCSTSPFNYTPDSSHQPSLAYLPYLVTGDHYYLEELQFWANWNMLQANPTYREFDKGLLKWDQVRGQAWSLRTLGQAAYITPDNDGLKTYFVDRVKNNIAWYDKVYAASNPNQLGILDGSGTNAFSAMLYTTPAGPQTGIAPWQDDFFTWSIGHLYELGYTEALSVLKWKSKFPVLRMTDPGFCWNDASVYTLAVRDSSSSPLYSTIKQAYLSTMRANDGTPLTNSTGARYLDQPCNSQAQANWRTQKDKDTGTSRAPWVVGEMVGYADSPSGFPSNLQPALAVAATSGISNARQAWTTFINRTVKPDYSKEPQFAVVPRE